ncbi:MAG TPA: hypothetical protein PLL30_07880 [Candidatus Krumholzibacteria bacterium]|nr:hypothetical protein [Candidatus Krumholzibacteria bacterium]HPD71676.1 hypothetical protein [Candidatus Krumholzibacteria bacterium]HRY41391.1 hypothetical protein [Candidatus Krumholzibacteria bacterium]
MRNRANVCHVGLTALIAISLIAISACGGGDQGPTDPGENQQPPITVDGMTADAECVDQFALIPPAVVAAVGDLRVYYGHTSHGSQLATGLDLIEAEDETYRQPHLYEPAGDLGHRGDLAWERTTRAYLADHAIESDVVVWSWCGGCSDNTSEGIDAYLDAMNQLEVDFPDIAFVYMTGHLDGSGPGGTLYASNDRIRAYCSAHGKWLFDFADIESHDPDGAYYPDETDACAWCADWCAQHDCPGCDACAHSHCFNCYRKGLAFWWLLGRIAGWQS